MSKFEESKAILAALEVLESQQSKICCLTLLALANLTENQSWSHASNEWIRIHDILVFLREHYDESYAENSRETFRKQAIHHFRTAAFIEDNGKATNSPDYRYRLTDEMLNLIRCYGKRTWYSKLKQFKAAHSSLKELYSTKRQKREISALVNGVRINFSPGKHNELQKAVLEKFAAHFAIDSKCIYVGDTTDKDIFQDTEILEQLDLSITQHDKMPDLVFYDAKREWIYFVEAVTSVGPMDPKRILELREMLGERASQAIYVTAFLDFNTYKKFANQIAWETEVWIAEMPEHMIHLNGDRFMGPR